MEEEKQENNELQETMRISKLLSVFKDAREAMGCPIKATYQCPSFVRFLDKLEKREYKRYKAEQEADDSCVSFLPITWFNCTTLGLNKLTSKYVTNDTTNN